MCMDKETSSANCLHLAAEADSSISEHAIKVRKPYIITKQRERWTEEEHNKFLEALKLYGRAWRRIEEHLGSKTTVQIRSHAQKFFSKVTRELSSNSPSIVEALEIPPPRPKRKPNHPYPRKLGHLSIKNGPHIDEPLWNSVPKQSASERESKSPTSVLSAYRCDTVGTTTADTIKPCMSPVSSFDRTVTVGEILVEQESGSKSSSTSTEYKCNHSTIPSASLGMQDASPMELDSTIQNSFASEEAPVAKQQITSLKLFGWTVIVADLQQQQPLSDENEFKYQESFSDCNKIDLESQKLQEKDKSEILGESSGECNPFNGGTSPKAPCSSSHENHSSPVEPKIVSFPSWWDLYGVMPFHFSRPMNPTSYQSPLDNKFVHIDPTSNESSQADSSTTSDSNSEAGESAVQMKELTPALALRQSKNSAFNSFRPSSANSTRGFVPYRR